LFDELLKYQTESSTNESNDAENNTVEEVEDFIESEGKENVSLFFKNSYQLVSFFIFIRNKNSSFKNTGII
jgi:hypothetical protein